MWKKNIYKGRKEVREKEEEVKVGRKGHWREKGREEEACGKNELRGQKRSKGRDKQRRRNNKQVQENLT